MQDASEDEVQPMIVSQYHFTGWPDHGAPDFGCEYPALDFILKSAAASEDGAGPIIVHCRWDSLKMYFLSVCYCRISQDSHTCCPRL